jgi:predicted DNA-binding protein YlxM (UPF0122 family)
MQGSMMKTMNYEECLRMHEKMKRRDDYDGNLDEIIQDQKQHIDEFDGVEFE